MYFSTNVMFRTLHSNSTIYLPTRLPSGDVKPHAVVLKACTVGVCRLPTYVSTIIDGVCMFNFQRVKCTLVCIEIEIKNMKFAEFMICSI